MADTLNERVHTRIKDQLMNGRFAPGQKLTIRALADELGTSVMPVRAALTRLAAVRALVPGAQRSFMVPPITKQRISELETVRANLEGLATELATANMLDREIQRLEILNIRMREATARRDQPGYFSHNHDFHWTIYKASCNETLISMIDDLWLQFGPVQFFTYDIETYRNAIHRHETVIDALRRRNPAAARAAMEADIHGASLYVIEHMRDLADQIRHREAATPAKSQFEVMHAR